MFYPKAAKKHGRKVRRVNGNPMREKNVVDFSEKLWLLHVPKQPE
jgi:hypothetical protein